MEDLPHIETAPVGHNSNRSCLHFVGTNPSLDC